MTPDKGCDQRHADDPPTPANTPPRGAKRSRFGLLLVILFLLATGLFAEYRLMRPPPPPPANSRIPWIKTAAAEAEYHALVQEQGQLEHDHQRLDNILPLVLRDFKRQATPDERAAIAAYPLFAGVSSPRQRLQLAATEYRHLIDRYQAFQAKAHQHLDLIAAPDVSFQKYLTHIHHNCTQIDAALKVPGSSHK